MGNVALAVNHPGTVPPKGWKWVPLTDLARMESGHTPSRKKKEYWGGEIPWIGIKDAKKAHGGTVETTLETTNALGIDNSSARVLPAGTICLSRTASVGYVVKMGSDMATSQDFANWVCSSHLDPDFLRYLFIAEGSALSRFSSGSVHQTIYYPELKAFHICIPSLEEQKRIVAVLGKAFTALDRAGALAEANLADAEKLFASFLENEFAERKKWKRGELGEQVKFIDYHGKTPPKADSGVRLITAKNVRMGFIRTDPKEFILKEAYDTWMTRGFPAIGDVLFTTEAPLANVAQLDTDEKVVIGQRLITFKTDANQIAPSFLKWSLISPQMQSEIHSQATGATVLGIKAKLLKKIALFVPKDVHVQKAIALKCEEAFRMSNELAVTYRSKIADLNDLRQSLLQKAFAGELT